MTQKRVHGKMYSGHSIPYGTLVGVDKEVRDTYYGYWYKEDSFFPELPQASFGTEQDVCLEDELYKKELAIEISKVLDTIPPRCAKVLRLRFGIGTSNNVAYTLEEVGRIFDLTRERIRQIEGKAMRLLKHPDRKLPELYAPQDAYEPTDRRKK